MAVLYLFRSKHGTGCLLVCSRLSSLIFHAFTASNAGFDVGGGGYEAGGEKRKRFCCSRQSIERLLPSFVLPPQVFFLRSEPRGKQKTNYEDGHHVTLPTCLWGTGPTDGREPGASNRESDSRVCASSKILREFGLMHKGWKM